MPAPTPLTHACRTVTMPWGSKHLYSFRLLCGKAAGNATLGSTLRLEVPHVHDLSRVTCPECLRQIPVQLLLGETEDTLGAW